ncbi:MAG: ABC transporter ATP-binding protein [Myxococcales bacterium]|nr:MAG: ABC transporter ATP-binding protein [Myxococcales bacterium]
MIDAKPVQAQPNPLEAIIAVEGLKKDYALNGKRIEVLKGVDLTLHPGERVSIVGKSGVGKSTFLHVLGTLDKPTAGTVLFEGADVFRLPEARLARYRNQTIGFVFQFHYLLPDFTALENVQIPMRIAGLPLSEARDRAAELLEQVGLGDRLEHKPGELSGGEQQRVALARAMVMRPKVLLADEPTGNLDEQTSEDIHELLLELNQRYDTTLVVVTHNRRLADRMGRRLALADGVIRNRTQEP